MTRKRSRVAKSNPPVAGPREDVVQNKERDDSKSETGFNGVIWDVSMSQLAHNYVTEHFKTDKQYQLASYSAALEEATQGIASLVMSGLEEYHESSAKIATISPSLQHSTPDLMPAEETPEPNPTKRRKLEDLVPKVDYQVHVSSPSPRVWPEPGPLKETKYLSGQNTHGSKVTKQANQPARSRRRLLGDNITLSSTDLTTGNLPHTPSGWQGSGPSKMTIEEIRVANVSNDGREIKKILADFFFSVGYNKDKPQPVLIFSKEKHLLLVRCKIAHFLVDLHAELKRVLQEALGMDLSDLVFTSAFIGKPRGDHPAIIFGHWRQSAVKPSLLHYHKTRMAEFQILMESPFFKKLIQYVCSRMDLLYPNVVARFLKSAAWHETKYGIKPYFGYFWNLCINGISPGMDRVHCAPHVDAKNPVAICALYVYCLPGYEFNHKERSWLVVWELGVVLELPPGVLVLYPSSLLFHWNMDVADIKFVRTVGDRPPTKETSLPLNEEGKKGRGSIVLFNQATMFQSSETGFDTLKLAAAAGFSTQSNYDEMAEMQFNREDLLPQEL
ncbi:hypothetical protein SCHPADRAFT_1001543 [Schizopora paradoxa]|uniref:Uncharacterized protein n=1 Tax=Schizopora paradoxa TaxID=27342 RepID=A0A0H2R6X5_9AGAM|nr:hypothetical protein SCHPADRAFT_1001543 [Schizopora paradoxa]